MRKGSGLSQTKRIINSMKFIAFSSLLLVIFAFTIKPGTGLAVSPQEPGKPGSSTDSTRAIQIDKADDDLAAFISGMGDGKIDCHPKFNESQEWKKYSTEMDSLFTHIISVRTSKMKTWADSQLVENHAKTTLFYPFSGPDFLNADVFYPDADQYIMVAMEPIGSLPDVCKMTPAKITDYLNSVNYSLRDIFKRSYFITSTMNADLYKTKVNGTIPLLCLFIKRTGHQIVSMQKVGIDSTGRCQVLDSLNKIKPVVNGVKINFLSLSGDRTQSIFYFRTDISDDGLAKKPAFVKYLNNLPNSHTYLKAASYLMHGDNFKAIRNIVFDKSISILQDDSGIAYRFFNKKVWDIKLYGVYVKPKDEFGYINEPELEKAYKTETVKPLPYTLGYNWRSGHSNMLYAVRKTN